MLSANYGQSGGHSDWGGICRAILRQAASLGRSSTPGDKLLPTCLEPAILGQKSGYVARMSEIGSASVEVKGFGSSKLKG